jgi:hypothetical protein
MPDLQKEKDQGKPNPIFFALIAGLRRASLIFVSAMEQDPFAKRALNPAEPALLGLLLKVPHFHFILKTNSQVERLRDREDLGQH